MKVSRAMRLSWLQLWRSMDEDGSNLLDYQEFVAGCELTDDLWSWRVLLVFDRSNAMEMAFRMCTRRGATCEPQNAVLDEKDIRIIVEHRQLQALALAPRSSRPRFTRPCELADVKRPLRIACKHAPERPDKRASDIPRARGALQTISTQREDTAGEAWKEYPGKPTVLWDEARDKTRMGRLKATGTVAKALHRMQLLLNGAEVSRIPGRNTTTVVKTTSSRALQTLKRATRIVAVARNASDALVPVKKEPRSERDLNIVKKSSDSSPSGGGRESGSSTDEALQLLGEEESSASTDTPGETPTIAESKTRVVVRENERQPWVVTEKFYAHVATAAARLEAKKNAEKGYDFSADFPKLWCQRRMHGNLGDTDTLSRQQRKTNASRRTAATYLRFIALWQARHTYTRFSRLDMAFRRWRLYTCDAAAEQLSVSTSSKKARDFRSSEGIAPNRTNNADVAGVPRHRQSVKEIWEAAGGMSREQNLHEIIMMKARSDRLLSWEVCEAFESEMVERVNQRQVENNVPMLPMPFC
ncbi:unnamed protein product [Laminaria digitata]